MQVKVHSRQHEMREGRRPKGTEFFQFYFRQLLVIMNTYFAENNRRKNKWENTILVNFE